MNPEADYPTPSKRRRRRQGEHGGDIYHRSFTSWQEPTREVRFRERVMKVINGDMPNAIVTAEFSGVLQNTSAQANSAKANWYQTWDNGSQATLFEPAFFKSCEAFAYRSKAVTSYADMFTNTGWGSLAESTNIKRSYATLFFRNYSTNRKHLEVYVVKPKIVIDTDNTALSAFINRHQSQMNAVNIDKDHYHWKYQHSPYMDEAFETKLYNIELDPGEKASLAVPGPFGYKIGVSKLLSDKVLATPELFNYKTPGNGIFLLFRVWNDPCLLFSNEATDLNTHTGTRCGIAARGDSNTVAADGGTTGISMLCRVVTKIECPASATTIVPVQGYLNFKSPLPLSSIKFTDVDPEEPNTTS